MTTNDPITPPPKMAGRYVPVEQWSDELAMRSDHAVLARAAQWGADQELEACCECLDSWGNIHNSYGYELASDLRTDRRPKPPSLKEQALLSIDAAVEDDRLSADVYNVVRRALEQLND